jgi:3-deoxy-D-manno-octulosonic-acid transferase
MFLIYTILYCVIAAVLLPFEYLKRPAPARKRWLKEKFGVTGLPVSPQGQPSLWVHAVSMGEVIAAVPFIREIRKRHPSLRIVLSTITDTGQQVARERLSGSADIIYLPFDIPFILKRLINKTRPLVFIAMETELWPNIFRVLHREGTAVLVMNARLSERSFRGYGRIRFFMKTVLRGVDMFCAQEEAYAARIRALGVDPERVTVTGNFKFDTQPHGEAPGWAESLRSPRILAGSTHPGEEELVLSVFERLRKDFPDLNLILAPRHPERFGEVERLVKAKGLSYVKRSEFSEQNGFRIADSQGNTQHSTPKIVILDTVGELASAYGACDLAVIGGSFARHGGQNPLEPASWGKAVVCGPHMENFPFITDFYREGAALQTSEEALYETLRELIESPEKRKTMGEKAKALALAKGGAVSRTADVLERYLDGHLPLSQEKPLP